MFIASRLLPVNALCCLEHSRLQLCAWQPGHLYLLCFSLHTEQHFPPALEFQVFNALKIYSEAMKYEVRLFTQLYLVIWKPDRGLIQALTRHR